jgi:hypothetical protein
LRWRDQVLVAQVHGLPTVSDGEETTIYLHPEALHPFNRASGKRVN